MPRVVPWLLVALCCVLAVASRSISDTFAVFVPALQDGFAASRSSVTVVYSFALFAGGTGAPLAGWIADHLGSAARASRIDKGVELVLGRRIELLRRPVLGLVDLLRQQAAGRNPEGKN